MHPADNLRTLRQMFTEAVDRIMERLAPPTRTYRSGIVRRLDDLGRVVLDAGMRRGMDLGDKAAVLHSIVVDADNRVRGILLEPLDYVIRPEARPTYEEAVHKMGNGKPSRLTPGPDLTQRRKAR